jgi:sugar (pentulose or hexulose) kinase
MARQSCLVLDVGASNGRAIVGLFDGRRFELHETHRFENQPVTTSGTLCWDAPRLLGEIKTGIRKSLAEFPGVASMGIDTWGVDFGLVDGDGRLLSNPVHYRDERRNAAAEEVFRIIPRGELFSLTGAPVLSLMSIFQLFAMRRDGAPALRGGERFLMMPDLFHYFLTGVACNEYTNATLTVAFNTTEKAWENRILDRLGIPRDLFGPPVLPGTRIGTLSSRVCAELEVPPVPVILPATHDSASAEAGIPVREGEGPWAFLSLGTWAILGLETAAPVVTDLVFTAGWGNEGSSEGGSYLAAPLTGLWIIQQCRQKWMKDLGGDLAWEDIVRKSLGVPPMGTFIDVDDPAFASVHPDVPGLIGEWCTSRGLRAPRGIGETARCVYESLVLKFRRCFQQLADIAGTRLELIHMVGGGTKNRTLCQWTADACGIPVLAGPTETTAAGNLLMQLKGLGEIADLRQGRAIVAASSETSLYYPRDTAIWDDAWTRFARTVG